MGKSNGRAKPITLRLLGMSFRDVKLPPVLKDSGYGYGITPSATLMQAISIHLDIPREI